MKPCTGGGKERRKFCTLENRYLLRDRFTEKDIETRVMKVKKRSENCFESI
jgi:hypothetical protein